MDENTVFVPQVRGREPPGVSAPLLPVRPVPGLPGASCGHEPSFNPAGEPGDSGDSKRPLRPDQPAPCQQQASAHPGQHASQFYSILAIDLELEMFSRSNFQ